MGFHIGFGFFFFLASLAKMDKGLLNREVLHFQSAVDLRNEYIFPILGMWKLLKTMLRLKSLKLKSL